MLLRLHVLLGSMGWVFPLLASVALTVVPMFLVTPAWPQRLARLLVPLNALTLLVIAVWPPLLPLLVLPVLAVRAAAAAPRCRRASAEPIRRAGCGRGAG